MDLSTLSQQLNISINELRAKMRGAGFRVSLKARKVDNSLAREIMKKLSGEPQAPEALTAAKPQKIIVSSFITVKDLAAKLREPVSAVIKKLIENGVMATINEEIDADTAVVIAADFAVEAEVEKSGETGGQLGLGYVAEILKAEEPAALVPRPPVAAVMGHVDHGKTTLLDAIRKTNVAATEAGAITQHIGAYQVEVLTELKAESSNSGREAITPHKITFLDTPGHEAFAAMRSRGANVTDIIVLVVAADDSVKPQTVEVINRAKLAKIPLIVAINKIDKPGANSEKVKGDLANLGVTVEEWGGKTPAMPVSAKSGEGIDKLLEIILLTAELEELKANPRGKTVGTVIESNLTRGQGVVATVLVQNGTLMLGAPVAVGATFGKIRTMQDALGKRLKQALPATPVRISGLSALPQVGDILAVAADLDEARMIARVQQKLAQAKKFQLRPAIKADPNQQELRVILRADVQGSLEAASEALQKLDSDEVKLKIVDQAVGEITESDVQLAENTKSVILGFHTRLNAQAAKLAKQKNLTVDLYDVIYELVEDVTNALLAMMPIKIVRLNLGRAKIKAVFRTEKDFMIVGGEMIEGKIAEKKKFDIIRDKAVIGEGKIEELQQNRVRVSEVSAGQEFGIKVKAQKPVVAGDILEIFDETVQKKEKL